MIAGINLLPILCCGQQIVWQNHYGGQSYETISYSNVKILKTNTGDYIYAAETSSYSGFANQYGIKIDASGNLLWQFDVGSIS